MKHLRLWVACAALFYCSAAPAQNSGTVTSHAFAVGKGPSKQGFTAVLCGLAQVAIGQTSADPICQSLSGDVTINASGVTAIGANKVTLGMHAALAADSVIGNFTGSGATPTALAFPNCTGALIYSTSTHVLGCNVAGGTGTVTSAQIIGASLAVNSGTCTITTTGACTITVTPAARTDQQTPTSNALAVTPLHQQDHDSAVKAWCLFSGTATGTNACTASYNVSGIARTATGAYTATFSPTPFASSTSYGCHAMSSDNATNGFIEGNTAVLSASTFGMFSINTAGSAFDAPTIFLACFGRQ